MVATLEMPIKTVGETRNGAISLFSTLDDAELLTGTPTITSTPSGLTFAQVKVNTVEVEVNELQVPVGKAIQFSVSGGTHNGTFKCRATVTTTSTPAQTLEVDFILKVMF